MDGFAFLIAVVTFVMALVALNRTAKLQTANFKLSQEIERLKAARPALQDASLPEPPMTTAAEPPPPETAAAKLEDTPSEPDMAPPPSAAPLPPRDVEQALAGRWFVWIGGVAIAIGGLLFVKYAYDNGLISPVLQVILGLVAGFALVGAGEWVRRRTPPAAGPAPNYVPAALSAAGLAVLFGALYAAYALYGILDPAAAFLGLAAVGLGALALSRWQGPLIAALGLLGSYVTPALIPSADPSAWTFFPYLLIILVSALLVLRGRAWWWLGYAAILGTLTWSGLWLIGPFEPGDVWPIGLSALVTGLAAMLVLEGPAMLRDESWPHHLAEASRGPLAIASTGLSAAVAVLVALALRGGHGDAALSLLSAGLALLVFFAWRKHALVLLAPAAAVVMLAVLGSWREAAFHAWTLDEHGIWSWSSYFGLATQRFLRWMLGAGGAFTLVGLAGVLWRRGSPVWGALAGGAALAFLWVAWARVDFMMSAAGWATLAAGTAMLLLLVTLWWSRRPTTDALGAGLLAAGAAALLVMALDLLLDGVWLSLAIAALALVYALASGVLKPRLMGPVTAALASLVALRLFLSRELWSDDASLPFGEHWVLYGYGLPAVALYAGSKALRRHGQEPSAVALEGISLGLVISLLSLEIRVLIGGGITYEDPRFLEMAAHILTWAGAAYGLIHRQRLFSSLVATWGARILLAMAAAGAVGLSLLALNPVVTGEPVPGGSIFNALLLAYLLPVPLVLLIARRLDVIGWGRLKPAAHVLALVLLFAYVTLETKRLFQGMMMTPWSQSLAENYAYSAVWLVFALALFVAGIRLARQPVRLAGLAVLALVVLKVFIGDMSNLGGLLRIASFVGLGFCLVGIGWLYQRFVRGSPVPQPAE
ncbi:hypothetical protein DK847_19285 [Aestuariivirga litoralis]|uniref:DUF2339 domain-containing protein n=1 Tax=Aestuariivirga litoralis TaxID=2650924 RepID=A0A2W2BGA5_9HYPH|nr:DUF2339 domain-containing protein [Aestuariivirga litoralis]PZF75249.1 hypothetical protein DK847_19285 [Aestuariivirga litoralis]